MAADLNASGQDLSVIDQTSNNLLNDSVGLCFHSTMVKTFESEACSGNKPKMTLQGPRRSQRAQIRVMDNSLHFTEQPCVVFSTSDVDLCSINSKNCFPVSELSSNMALNDDVLLKNPHSPHNSFLIMRDTRGSNNRTLVPFANTNIYNTEIQFYIQDDIDLKSLCLLPKYLNANQNNDTPLADEGSRTLIDNFSSKVNSERAPEPVSVVNLSSRPLSDDETYVLALGKGFCPTPGEPNMGEIKADLDRLHTKCRTKLFFDKSGEIPINKSKTAQSSSSSPNIHTTQDPTPDAWAQKSLYKGGFANNLFKEKIFRKTTKWVPPRGPPTFETFAILNELALNKTPTQNPGTLSSA